jgi:hypothetical protein
MQIVPALDVGFGGGVGSRDTLLLLASVGLGLVNDFLVSSVFFFLRAVSFVGVIQRGVII